MRRRDFIAGLGGAGTWPLSGRAQSERIPVIGFLAAGSNDAKRWGASFPQGLKEAGYVEGQNLAIEYRGGLQGWIGCLNWQLNSSADRWR
jgi:putative tryptophan/tyrosine transport system substrate-binding protein